MSDYRLAHTPQELLDKLRQEVFSGGEHVELLGYCSTCDEIIDSKDGWCPKCSGGLEDVKPCVKCDKPTRLKELKGGFCKVCGLKVNKRLQYFLNNEFTEAEREYLSEVGYVTD